MSNLGCLNICEGEDPLDSIPALCAGKGLILGECENSPWFLELSWIMDVEMARKQDDDEALAGVSCGACNDRGKEVRRREIGEGGKENGSVYLRGWKGGVCGLHRG